MKTILSTFPMVILLINSGGIVGAENQQRSEIVTWASREARIDEVIPSPDREFRAAWVATVYNIDWPSKPGLAESKLKEEAIGILDFLVEMNMNAVILQVRPQADALYRSQLEPWSYFLTGEQGRAPASDWDPLAYWIDESHKRGIQLHAWFNPYRANVGRYTIHETSVVKARPDLVVKLGRHGMWWLNPSNPEAKKHTINVILDVVKRYDIDGVHLDDYFYPYPSYNKYRKFPDQPQYDAYRNRGGTLELGDWRRHHVNDLIQRLYREIKTENPRVEFGISPFGIWRPGYPKGIRGLDQYNEIYADARLWLNEGWVDYFMPQLYWPISARRQGFKKLLDWWSEQNIRQRHLWPGLNLSVAAKEKNTEVVDQVRYTRSVRGDDTGVCLFSMKRVNYSFAGIKALREGLWTNRALIPATPWLDCHPPSVPRVGLVLESGEQFSLKFDPWENDCFQFVINEKRAQEWGKPHLLPGMRRHYAIDKEVQSIAIRAVDRSRNMSRPVIVDIPKKGEINFLDVTSL